MNQDYVKLVDEVDRKLEPLTDEQIIRIWERYCGDTRISIINFARALEKEHGIRQYD